MAAAITGQVANHIEAIPCNPQAIHALLPSILDTTIVSKAITQSSGQSHLMHPKAEWFARKAQKYLEGMSPYTSACLQLHKR